MRFKLQQAPKDGDVRIVKTFAFIPVIVGRDIRWFEFVKIKQQYSVSGRGMYVDRRWVNVQFID